MAGRHFDDKWNGKAGGALYNAHDTMSQSWPSTLKVQAYADVVAYILEGNGPPAGSGGMPMDAAQMDAMAISTSGAQP